MVRALNYMHAQAASSATLGMPFQYILTFNEDELALAPEEKYRDGEFTFDPDEATILELSDDEPGMLFKRRFS